MAFLWAVPPDVLAFHIGPLGVGGAVRVNYIYGSYEDDGGDGPQRGGAGGNFELDTFRVNLFFDERNFLGRAEYRWYNGYNFVHTAWVGYDFPNRSQVQIGVNRVPFGVGPYGPSNSWFFDQHYYVGLADDMDVGVKYRLPLGHLALDFAYYVLSEPNGLGDTLDSARYSYDMVNEEAGPFRYEERHQLNFRAVYLFERIPVPTALGVSGQWGRLESRSSVAEDSYAYAVAVHTKSTAGPWTLMFQITRYEYQADFLESEEDGGGLSDDLIGMGAYDFAWPVASKGTIPSVSLRYTWQPTPIEWIDSIRFYNDWSVILKEASLRDGTEFNDSMLNVTGMSVSRGGWFTYVDFALSNGNYFVGNEGDDYSSFRTVGDFGVNGNDKWNQRFNINFGYYF